MPDESGTFTPDEVDALVAASNALAEAGIAAVAAQQAVKATVIPTSTVLLDGVGRSIATLGKAIDFILGDRAPDHSEQTERLLAIARS